MKKEPELGAFQPASVSQGTMLGLSDKMFCYSLGCHMWKCVCFLNTPFRLELVDLSRPQATGSLQLLGSLLHILE